MNACSQLSSLVATAKSPDPTIRFILYSAHPLVGALQWVNNQVYLCNKHSSDMPTQIKYVKDYNSHDNNLLEKYKVLFL